MRLIDADALKKEAVPLWYVDDSPLEFVSARDIACAPTIEAEPVTHGRWIINPDGYYPYCSECKGEPKHGEMTKYCPNCGACMNLSDTNVGNMDGKENEDA